MRHNILRITPIALAGVAAFACGGPETGLDENGKPKPVLEQSDIEETSLAADAVPPGNWTELRVVESAHPYANNQNTTWTVSAAPGTAQIRLSFERFEVENGYDFVTVMDELGSQRTRHTGTKTGTQLVVNGAKAKVVFTTDRSVTKWGFRIRAFQKDACVCTAIFQPVCGQNGQTYSNACAARCAAQPVAYAGECRNDWFTVQRTIESVHPYADSFRQEWQVGEGGATQIRLHFEQIDLESGYDFLRVKTPQGAVVATYTGAQRDVTTPIINASGATIELTTDGSITKFGFKLDRYDVRGGCNSNADCGANQTCVQITCIRAPCFNQCVDATPAVVDVTLADLNANPAQYTGQKIRVTAEPKAEIAACTRIACSPANPCCNRCSGNFTLEGGIYLQGQVPGGNFGCAGDSCNWQTQCAPFKSSDNGQYSLVGVFTLDGVSGTKNIAVESFSAASCRRGGCSGEACANVPVIGACIFRPEFACFANATCTAQSDGHCGWTQTPELQMCVANGGNVTPPALLTASDTPIPVPDNNTAGIVSHIMAPDYGVLRNAVVSVRITHPYKGDLSVKLVSPDGTGVVLHDRAGGSADDVVITNMALPTLAGHPSAGDWRLEVRDTGAADVGALNTWSLSLNQ